MVALAVRALGGVTTPSLARPMLQAANTACLAGRPIEAAAKLREALRRHLAAECASHALESEGDGFTLLKRLQAAGSPPSRYYGELLSEAEDVLALRDAGKYFATAVSLAFNVIQSDNRGGA